MSSWLVFQAPEETAPPCVTLVENLPIGASPRDYMRQLADLLEDTDDFPIIFIQVLQSNFSPGLLEVFDWTGSRVAVNKVRLG